MTYNHPTYKGHHSYHKEIADLEDLIGVFFVNYSKILLVNEISRQVNALKDLKINIVLHQCMPEDRDVKFFKYHLNYVKAIGGKQLNMMDKLEIIKQEKIAAIRAQNYPLAANFRDIEKEIVECINSKDKKEVDVDFSIIPQKSLQTAIEICEHTIHVYAITSFAPFNRMLEKLIPNIIIKQSCMNKAIIA